MKTKCCGHFLKGCMDCPPPPGWVKLEDGSVIPAAPQPHLTPVGAGDGNTYVVHGYTPAAHSKPPSGFGTMFPLTGAAPMPPAPVKATVPAPAAPAAESPEPLTDEQILALRQWGGSGVSVYFDKLGFARAVIAEFCRVNGIGSKP